MGHHYHQPCAMDTIHVLCVCVCKNLIFTLAALNILGKGVHKKALGIKLWWVVS